MGWGSKPALCDHLKHSQQKMDWATEQRRTESTFVGPLRTFEAFKEHSVYGENAIQINLSDILGIEDLAQIHGASKIVSVGFNTIP